MDQRGFRVAPATNAHFADNLKTRCWLEERAIVNPSSMAERIRKSVSSSLMPIVPCRREEEADFYDPVSWEALHKKFHLALINACGSEILLRICSQHDQNVGTAIWPRTVQICIEDVSSELAPIFAAAMDRNADLTVEILLERYTRTGGFLPSTSNTNPAHLSGVISPVSTFGSRVSGPGQYKSAGIDPVHTAGQLKPVGEGAGFLLDIGQDQINHTPKTVS